MRTKFFAVPWASSGDATSIPDTADPSNNVSFAQGWTSYYSLQYPANPAAKPITRVSMNYLFNAITASLQALQTYGIPEWIATADNDGTPFPYDVHAQVLYSATGLPPFTPYISAVTANTSVPGADANWLRAVETFATQAQVNAGTSLITAVSPGTLAATYLPAASAAATYAPKAGLSTQTFAVAAATAASMAVNYGQTEARYALTTGSTTTVFGVATPGPTALSGAVPLSYLQTFGTFMSVYQAAGTYAFTVPANVTRLHVRVVGGGGGAGGSGTALSAGGGAGGGYAEGWYTVTAGQVVTVVVGASGAGGTAGNIGAAGGTSSAGTSSVGSLCSATGGGGGGAGGGGSGAGGFGGAGSGGQVNSVGSDGGDGASSGAVGGGAGGSSALGGSTRSGTQGRNSLSIGGGGSATYTLQALPGGSGQPGVVILEY